MYSPKHILFANDEADLVELVSDNLTKEGFTVDSVSDGLSVLSKVKKGQYDLLILDLLLPEIHGLEICSMVRNDPNTAGLPIIMLTAKAGEFDKILGLEMGADDYMTKPFSPRELVARIRAVLRRSNGRAVLNKRLKMGEIEIDMERCSVSVRGEQVKLSATEFKLLCFLAESRGRVVARNQLIDAVWRDESLVNPRTVDVHISRLRSCIEEDPSNPAYIKTLRGIGYLFDAE